MFTRDVESGKLGSLTLTKCGACNRFGCGFAWSVTERRGVPPVVALPNWPDNHWVVFFCQGEAVASVFCRSVLAPSDKEDAMNKVRFSMTVTKEDIGETLRGWPRLLALFCARLRKQFVLCDVVFGSSGKIQSMTRAEYRW